MRRLARSRYPPRGSRIVNKTNKELEILREGDTPTYGKIVSLEREIDLLLCVARINCFSQFLNGNGSGNCKW